MLFFTIKSPLALGPSAGELVKEFLVENLVGVLAPHGEEDVAADELVHHLALGRQALEDDAAGAVPAQLDHHVAGLPVDVPRLDRVVPPGGHVLPPW